MGFKRQRRAVNWKGLALLVLAGLMGALAWTQVALAQEEESRAGAMLAGVVFFVAMIMLVVMYVYMAVCLQTIAKKTNTENPWLAWIPIANIILMLNIAHKPLWWFLLMLIP